MSNMLIAAGHGRYVCMQKVCGVSSTDHVKRFGRDPVCSGPHFCAN